MATIFFKNCFKVFGLNLRFLWYIVYISSLKSHIISFLDNLKWEPFEYDQFVKSYHKYGSTFFATIKEISHYFIDVIKRYDDYIQIYLQMLSKKLNDQQYKFVLMKVSNFGKLIKN